MKKPMKKLLTILLALLLVISNGISVFAEGDDVSDDDSGDMSTTEIYEYDAKLLKVQKYGKVAEESDKQSIFDKKDTRKRSSTSDLIRVSIVLEEPATLSLFDPENVAENKKAIDYREKLFTEQSEITDKIEDELGKDLDVVWNLTLAANIISANVSVDDIEAIENLDGVACVEIETLYMPMDDTADPDTAFTTEYMVGATQAWADGYTGAGSKVAIIDTGTNQDHISFSGDALIYALEQEGYDASILMDADDVAAVAGQLNVDIDPALTYKSAKIPYAYNYVDEDYETDHANDDESEHGSHVSGIAAANTYVFKNGSYVEAVSDNTVYAVGVAPDAQILTMKVFGKGGGAYDSDYMAAIEDAIVLGADSINLSLGSGSAGFATAGTYQEIMDSLVSNSSVVAMSAGNAGAWTDYLPYHYDLYAEDINLDTGGSPGSYANSLTVASADNVGTSGTPLYFDDIVRVFYLESSSSGDYMVSLGGQEYDYVYIDAVGESEEYAAVDAEISLAGKIVIVNRGDINFADKGNNAIPYNPKAVIVANNKNDGLGGMALDDYTGSFPMVLISLADANEIKSNSHNVTVGTYKYYTGKVKVNKVIETEGPSDREDAVISSFSSWGTSGALLLKPEITAPGGNIWSVNGMTDEYYESMSGTSMAAPHVTGMAAVLGQYLRAENDEDKTVLELAQEASGKDDLKARHVINSLLMSTATPMMDEDDYYVSLLQQGSGLADVGLAVKANSFILMGEDATASAADGKVKVELGQDAQREGIYTYTFTVNNISDEDIIYELDTDLFTQYVSSGYMRQYTDDLDADVEYEFELPPLLGHDFNVDGDTNYDDVQSILDYLTGIYDRDEYDLDAGEMDDDGSLTTRDAYLLGLWIENEIGVGDGQLLVPAHNSSKVTVTIILTDSQKEALDEDYTGGAYIEGFTKLNAVATEEGAILDVEHSIPILGFYGSWTDASMFDNTEYVEVLYETDEKIPYMGNYDTNYMTVKYPGDSDAYIYTGNPYMMDDEFPVDRLALNSSTTVSRFVYTLIRGAGTTAWVAIDEDGNAVEGKVLKNQANAPWYYTSGGSWQDANPKKANVNTRVSEFGFEEGDRFTLGVFAIPEYYSLMLENGSATGSVSTDEIAQLLNDGELGEGAYMGYNFVIDDTAPVIDKVEIEDNKLTVTAHDNQYIAIIQLMSLDGAISYQFALPEQTEPGETVTYTFEDISEIDAAAVAVFVADYAANEKAVLARLSDDPITVKKTIYTLTDELVAGNDYVITNSNKAGDAVALLSKGYESFTDIEDVTVLKSEEHGLYINGDDISDGVVWTAYDGIRLMSNDDKPGFLEAYANGYPAATWDGSDWEYRDGDMTSGRSYLFYYSGYGFLTYSSALAKTYIYAAKEIDVEFNPDIASSVTVSPAAETLILNVKEETELYATVLPINLDDKTVTWSSSDENIATVDENGKVTAVAIGSVTITATSNKTPGVSGTATINVVDSNPLEDGYVLAQVAYGEDIYFAVIDLETMDVYPQGEAYEPAFIGGGQSGNYLFGTDEDEWFVTYEINDEGEIVLYDDYTFAASSALALLDGFNVPDLKLYGSPDAEPLQYMAGGLAPDSKMVFFDKDQSFPFFDWSGDANFIAATFTGKMEWNDHILYVYYALADDGMLWLLGVYNNGAGGLGAAYGTIGQINMLTIGDDLGAYSMTYAGYIMTEEDAEQPVDAIFLADNTSKAIYYVDLSPAEEGAEEFDAMYIGRLPEATNLTSLFDNAYDAVKDLSSNISPERLASILADSKIKEASYLNARNEDAGESVAPAGQNRTSVHKVNSIKSPVGSLNSIKNYVPGPTKKASTSISRILKNVSTVVGEAGKLTIEISEEDVATNGLYTIKYDPDKVAYKDDSEDARFISIAIDQENGEIKFAFVDLDGIEAGKVITTIEFEALCEDSEIVTETKERNNALDLSEKINTPVEGIGHAWGEPQWQWSNGNTEATATFTCGNDPDHQEVVPATVTKTEQLPTETEDGWRTFTATVTLEGNTYTATKTIKLDKHGKIPVPDTGRK